MNSMNSFGFYVEKENYRHSGKLMVVGLGGDFLCIDNIKGEISKLKLFDDYNEWFRPFGTTTVVDDVEFMGEHKFVRFESNRTKEQFVVIFSKSINHVDMSDLIRHVSYTIDKGFCTPIAAGFCVGEKYYGYSESIGIDHNGKEI